MSGEPASAVVAAAEPDRSFSLAAERLLLGRMLASLGSPPIQLVLWDGQQVGKTHEENPARLLVRDRSALLRLIADPEFRFGELYVDERIEVDGNLTDFLETLYRALPRNKPLGFKEKLLAPFSSRRHSAAQSANNIYHHYDIGNDFYKLWLDEQLVYTCAYFPQPRLDLEQAQVAKLDYICRKLRLRPGETVVEAGCGWGAMALHMARHYGVQVKAFNLSREQIQHARLQAQSTGLAGQVEFVERDYRDIDGQFDAFVSVGMLEHVGLDEYHDLGALINRCLKPDGRGLIHSIGRDQPGNMNTWIERYIFPGACPPSLSQMMAIFEPNGLSILDVENLRLHYAQTLTHWLQRFEAAADRVRDMFDESFVRTWRLYLAGSLASFRAGDLQLFQVAFSRNGNNQIPWSRQDVYQEAAHADL